MFNFFNLQIARFASMFASSLVRGVNLGEFVGEEYLYRVRAKVFKKETTRFIRSVG